MAEQYVEIPLSFDLGDVDRSADSEIIPEGVYLLKTKARYSPPKDGHDPGLIVLAKVIDTEPENRSYIGAEFATFVSLGKKSDFRLANYMDAVYGRKVDGNKIQLPDLDGQEVVGNVIKDDYDNKIRSKVDRFLHKSKWRVAPGSGAAKPAAPKQPELPTSAPKPAPKAAPKPAPAPAPAEGDDDVPI